MKRPLCISIAGLLVLSLLTGCSAAGQMRKQQEQPEDETGDAGASVQEDGTEDLQVLIDAGFPYHLNGRYAVRGEMIYFASNEAVYGYNQITGEFEIFSLTGEKYEMPKTYSGIADDGKLYLDGEYLYYFNDFYHEREDRSESLLYQVDLSTGEAYQVEFSFDQYVTDLYILDHQMYLRTYDENYNTGYHTIALEENGEIGEEITGTREDGRVSIPAGYEEIQILDMEGWLYYAYQNLYFSQILLQDENQNYVLYDPDTEEVTELLSSDYSVNYYDGWHILYYLSEYMSEDGAAHQYYRNLNTGEEHELSAEKRNVIGADVEGIYYMKHNSETDLHQTEDQMWYQTYDSLDQGWEGQYLYQITWSPYIKNNLDLVENSLLTLSHGALYVIEDSGDQTVFASYNWLRGESENAVVLADREINQIGQFYYEADEELCEDCGKPVYAYYIEGFTLNGSMPGDEAINAQVQEITDSMIKNAAGVGMDEEEYHEEAYYMEGSVTCEVDLSYYNDRYIGLLWSGYDDYSGAAHGMPYTDFRLYDRETGEELYLDDILASSEEELNAIVTRMFEERHDGDEIWEWGLEYISENAGFLEDHHLKAGDYYLTDEGLVYYFGAYEVASYAEGMPEVLIPYDELKWKIDLS
ncbi:MAG TPA: hypothetical protein DFI63_04835 [Lachnospiraceae bacterium]|nr:hypothetical protein [Lachnospiraceae bacterium]